ncbi:MAG: hypothetical protein CO143_02925, partial [Candidatus Moranbacteria bacterium CG_4_9_14_3_um_filter_45_14]
MKHFLSKIIPQSLKNQYHLMQAVIACVCFGFPAYDFAHRATSKIGKKMQVIGVTGTNGKTTTTHLIARILERAGKKVAVASTINFQIGEKKWVNASKFTTLSSWELQKFLQEALRTGCEYAVIETSSHALDQHRVWGISYAIAVMTNVTREHLDYHKTMSTYRFAKGRLFRSAKQAVVNLDMEDPDYFCVRETKQTLFYSTKDPNAHLFAEHIELDFKGTEFTVDEEHFHLHLPGLFNIENALASLGVARLLDIDFSLTGEALASVAGVPGRMELVPNEK